MLACITALSMNTSVLSTRVAKAVLLYNCPSYTSKLQNITAVKIVYRFTTTISASQSWSTNFSPTTLKAAALPLVAPKTHLSRRAAKRRKEQHRRKSLHAVQRQMEARYICAREYGGKKIPISVAREK